MTTDSRTARRPRARRPGAAAVILLVLAGPAVPATAQDAPEHCAGGRTVAVAPLETCGITTIAGDGGASVELFVPKDIALTPDDVSISGPGPFSGVVLTDPADPASTAVLIGRVTAGSFARRATRWSCTRPPTPSRHRATRAGSARGCAASQ